MNDTTTFDAMPAEVATALLLSGQSMSNRFRKVCNTARERIAEPVSRSTRLNVSAPATPLQKFERKLRKANAKQLTTWLRRATRRGNLLQDTRDEVAFDTRNSERESKTVALLELLTKQIGQMDAIAESIKNELEYRQSRGKVLHV